MLRYCKSLFIFYSIKTDFYKNAFEPNTNICTNNSIDITNANKLYYAGINNKWFINEMKKGCQMGGNQTKCHIDNSDVNDIITEFNNSYNLYIQNPILLCVAFSEFTNNLEKLFVTGGCYLENTSKHICDIYKSFKCK